MSTLLDEHIKHTDCGGYEVPYKTSDKAKLVIKTLAECGCVEVIFDDETVEISNELLRFAANYGITVYKNSYSFILCDNPVKRKI